MKSYEIKYEPVIVGGSEIPKYNVYYYDGEEMIGSEFHSSDGKNGSVREGFKNKNAPDWLGLEQALRYSTLFNKAWSTASDKGFSLFTITLLNGKRGDSSENALAFAFNVLGVVWSEEEIDQLNEILSNHKFTIML